MIPGGLAATQVAFMAWRAGGTTFADLADEDLAHAYNVLSSLAQDIEDSRRAAGDQLVRRLMAIAAAREGSPHDHP